MTVITAQQAHRKVHELREQIALQASCTTTMAQDLLPLVEQMREAERTFRAAYAAEQNAEQLATFSGGNRVKVTAHQVTNAPAGTGTVRFVGGGWVTVDVDGALSYNYPAHCVSHLSV